MREKFKSFINFSASRQFRLPGQTVGLAGRRAGAVFFARHLDDLLMPRNTQALPGLGGVTQFQLNPKLTTIYLDWQKTRHRDTDGN